MHTIARPPGLSVCRPKLDEISAVQIIDILDIPVLAPRGNGEHPMEAISSVAADSMLSRPTPTVGRFQIDINEGARVSSVGQALAEIAAGLPRRFHVNGVKSRVFLKRLRACYLPSDLIDRSKVDIDVLLIRWFAEPLFLGSCGLFQCLIVLWKVGTSRRIWCASILS